MPDTEFDVSGLTALPRVDIIYAYPGSDGTAVRAFMAAGAKGIVSAGFAPGSPPPADLDALTEAVKKGVTVVQSSRAGSGRIFRSKRLTDAGILAGDNLNPQKARLLAVLALAHRRPDRSPAHGRRLLRPMATLAEPARDVTRGSLRRAAGIRRR